MCASSCDVYSVSDVIWVSGRVLPRPITAAEVSSWSSAETNVHTHHDYEADDTAPRSQLAVTTEIHRTHTYSDQHA